MTYIDRHILETYRVLLEGLNPSSKLALIDTLSKSLKVEAKVKDDLFFKSFGGFVSDNSAEEIIEDLRASRNFRHKEIEL